MIGQGMTWWVKCFPYKHENMCSYLQDPHKRWDMPIAPPKEVEIGRSGDLTSQFGGFWIQ